MRLRRGTRVLDGGDGTLVIGTRPSLTLDASPPDRRQFLERLESAADLTPLQRERWAPLLADLARHDLLEPPAATPGSVGITDAGPVGLAVGHALARDGWAVRFVDPGPIAGAPASTYTTGVVAAAREGAACATVRAALPLARVVAGEGAADAWVIISQGAPDLARALPLMAHDVPHLWVVADERGALVGPWVMPGDSACGWCDGHARTSADPRWPTLALQWAAPASVAPLATPDVVAGIASLAAGALGGWLAGDGHHWADARWALTSTRPPRAESLPPRSECGCGAAVSAARGADDLAARRAKRG